MIYFKDAGDKLVSVDSAEKHQSREPRFRILTYATSRSRTASCKTNKSQSREPRFRILTYATSRSRTASYKTKKRKSTSCASTSVVFFFFVLQTLIFLKISLDFCFFVCYYYSCCDIDSVEA